MWWYHGSPSPMWLLPNNGEKPLCRGTIGHHPLQDCCPKMITREDKCERRNEWMRRHERGNERRWKKRRNEKRRHDMRFGRRFWRRQGNECRKGTEIGEGGVV